MRGVFSLVRVIQEGPDGLSLLSCPGYLSGDSTLFPHRSSAMADKDTETAVVGGVDTHKDLHVAAIVDENNKVSGSRYFPITRQGYRQMLAWMVSFGTLKRVYRYLWFRAASLFSECRGEALEVAAPDRMERRKRGKVTRFMLSVLHMQHSPE